MKKILLSLSAIFLLGSYAKAQNEIQEILRSGIDDATKFSNEYIRPVSEAAIYNMANGWYNSGEAKKLFHFELGIVANAAFVPDDKQTFNLNVNDYDYLSFQDGSQSKQVATVFGYNDPEVTMVVQYEGPNGTMETTTVDLPQGIGDTGVNIMPSAFIQGSIGLPKGFELKARFLPNLDFDGAETSFYGGALQHEFTNWITGEKLLPVAISGLIGYTKLNASYDLDETPIQGDNQKIETEMGSWMFTTVVSTKLPVINFYGGLGYVSGKGESSLKGSYTIDEGPLAGETLVNPYTVTQNVSGVNATLGFKLKLGFFRLNGAYSFQEYNTAHVGINFGY